MLNDCLIQAFILYTILILLQAEWLTSKKLLSTSLENIRFKVVLFCDSLWRNSPVSQTCRLNRRSGSWLRIGGQPKVLDMQLPLLQEHVTPESCHIIHHMKHRQTSWTSCLSEENTLTAEVSSSLNSSRKNLFSSVLATSEYVWLHATRLKPTLKLVVVSLLYTSLRIHNASFDSINTHFIKNGDMNSFFQFKYNNVLCLGYKSYKFQYKIDVKPVVIFFPSEITVTTIMRK